MVLCRFAYAFYYVATEPVFEANPRRNWQRSSPRTSCNNTSSAVKRVGVLSYPVEKSRRRPVEFRCVRFQPAARAEDAHKRVGVLSYPVTKNRRRPVEIRCVRFQPAARAEDVHKRVGVFSHPVKKNRRRPVELWCVRFQPAGRAEDARQDRRRVRFQGKSAVSIPVRPPVHSSCSNVPVFNNRMAESNGTSTNNPEKFGKQFEVQPGLSLGIKEFSLPTLGCLLHRVTCSSDTKEA